MTTEFTSADDATRRDESTQKIQRCVACDEPTGRCEEDSIYLPPKDPNGSDLGPLCEACCDERDPPRSYEC